MAHLNLMTEMQQPVMPKTCRHPTLSATELDDSFAFICDGCQEMGYRSCYQCKNGCNYMLHKVCTMASEVAHHPFFERPLTLQLQQFPNSGNLCTACGIAVTGWRYYHTLESGSYVFLHPCCMKMARCIEEEDGDRKLFLKQQLVSLECVFCERTTLEGPIKGWAYMSADQELVCHIRCIKDTKYEDYWSMYGHTEEQEGLGGHNRYTGAKALAFAKAAVKLLVLVTNPVCWIMAVCDMLGFTITPL